MVAPVLRGLADAGTLLVAVFSQDDPEFPDGLGPLAVSDDRELDTSFALDIDTVPTLLLWSAGIEVARTVGWSRSQWEAVAGIDGLGADLPDLRPGCGSRTHDPHIADQHAVAQMLPKLRSRRLELGTERRRRWRRCSTRGFTDGLPWCRRRPSASPRMLTGTTRAPDEIVAVAPPDLVECTVEKVAINAVLAGCRPEYLPVVLAAVEAACTDEFNIHGLLARPGSPGPLVIVNGPVDPHHRDEHVASTRWAKATEPTPRSVAHSSW